LETLAGSENFTYRVTWLPNILVTSQAMTLGELGLGSLGKRVIAKAFVSWI
jgi:hypothetical protein